MDKLPIKLGDTHRIAGNRELHQRGKDFQFVKFCDVLEKVEKQRLFKVLFIR